jgi:hypothetical protein
LSPSGEHRNLDGENPLFNGAVEELMMGRYVLLWALGVPIPILILVWALVVSISIWRSPLTVESNLLLGCIKPVSPNR